MNKVNPFYGEPLGSFLNTLGEGPFLDPREAKNGKKKVNRQTPDKKNYRQKKLTNAAYFVEKKSWLYDN